MSDDMEKPTQESAARELLEADFKYFSDSFWKNEEVGERRIDFFMGLVTAALAGLTALINAEHGLAGSPLKFVVIAGLFFLLMIGWITFLRLLKRNKTTDEYKNSLDDIRKIIKDHFDPGHGLALYEPIKGPRTWNKRSGLLATLCKLWLRRCLRNELNAETLDQYHKQELDDALKGIRTFGGLVDYVAGVNAALVAGVVAAFIYSAPSAPELAKYKIGNPEVVVAWGLTAFWLAFGVQLLYIMIDQVKAKRELRGCGNYTHEFGLVYKIEDGVRRYLLVKPTGGGDLWVLPKGHIEGKERYGETALREVKEETGVEAKKLECIGEISFQTQKKQVCGCVFLMEYISQGKPKETSREPTWFTKEELGGIYLPEETKELLKRQEDGGVMGHAAA